MDNVLPVILPKQHNNMPRESSSSKATGHLKGGKRVKNCHAPLVQDINLLGKVLVSEKPKPILQ